MTIKKEGGKFVVRSKAGKKLGSHSDSNASRARAPMVAVTDEVLEAAFEALACGITLNAFCREPNRPSRSAIWRVVSKSEALTARYEEARRMGYDVIAEGALALIDEPIEPGEDGRIDPALVTQRKAQFDARLRLLAKWDTARYGDKLQVDGGGVNIIIAPPVVRSRDAEFEVVEDEPRRLNGNGHGRLGDG